MSDPRQVYPLPLSLVVELCVMLLHEGGRGMLWLTVDDHGFETLGGRPGEKSIRVAGPAGWIDIERGER